MKCISEKLNFENRKWKTEKPKFEIENVAMNSAKIQLFVPKDESSSANSRFVSWLFQFLSEFLSLNQYFVYFWNVKCRNTPRDKAAKRWASVS